MLAGHVIVIIGGTTGLGSAGAQACLAAGAKAVCVGLDEASSQAAAAEFGEAALVITGDARDLETAPRAIEMAVREFGGFHGLYHVAGGSGRKWGDGPLHEMTDEGWNETLRLNLTSVFYSNRAAVRQFLRQGTGGSILNMGSVLSTHPAPRYFATHAYAAAKAAIEGFTRSCAAYYAPRDIRINAVLPGLVDTPMARRAMSDPDIQVYLKTRQPLGGGRAGQPSDLDAAVVFFLSAASRFVTGQILAVDGGWSVSEGPYPNASQTD
ncbi:MAG: SDR family NAD(P)-dependent oxidoreductase [bacterium]